MGKQYIVKGAMAQCNQSKVPMIAQLNLIPDNMFVNMNGNPVATTMTLGPVFGPAPFGICNMIPPTPAVPTPPCVCAILSWSGADTAVKINMISNPLTTDSKGTCALGGSISFKMSGQFPKPSIPPIPTPAAGDMNAAATKPKPAPKKKKALPPHEETPMETKAPSESTQSEDIQNGYNEKLLRAKYQAEANAIKKEANNMINQMVESGTEIDKAEDIAARWANQRRNELKIKYLKKTPEDLRKLIFEFNILRGKKSRYGTVTYNYLHYKKALSPTEIIDSAARPQEGPQVVAANMMKTFNKEKAEAETELRNAMEQEEINEAKARLKRAKKRIEKTKEVLKKYNMLAS